MPYTRARSFLIFVFSLIVPTLVVGAQQQKPDQSAAIKAEAQALWQKGQQWPAINKLKEAITLNPADPATHIELADMYLAVRSNDLAREAVAQALKIDPNYAPAHQKQAVLLRYSGDFEGSIREARLALSLKPDEQTTAYSHITLGRAFLKLRQIAAADEEFRKAINVYQERINQKPDDVYAHLTRGDIAFEVQHFDEAEKSYRRALELKPQESTALQALASTLHNQGKKDEAVRYYQEYLRSNPDAESKSAVEARIKSLESTPVQTLLSGLLIYAAENGNLSNVNALIARGADVNFKDRYKTSLNQAAQAGYIEIVKVLLAHGAKDEDGSALAAAYGDDYTEIEKLLDRPAKSLSPEAVKRLLYAAVYKNDAQRFASLIELTDQKQRDEFLLYTLSQSKKQPLEIIRSLLDKGANVNQPTNSKTALMYAADKGYTDVVSLLLAKGAQVNARTDDGTALMEAVTSGHIDIVKLLLAAGADVKAVHRMGDQALTMAASQRKFGSPSEEPNPEIVQLLLERGADPNARGQWSRTALMSANTAAKVKLLVTKGAEVDAKDEYGQTALMHAASRGEPGVVSALLESGANVNATDNEGMNALLLSLNEENYAHDEERKTLPERRLAVARRILLEKSVDVNAQNNDRETALMRAVRLENVEMVKSLLARAADVNRIDVLDDSAVTLAYEKGNAEIEKLLPAASLKGQPVNVLNGFLRAAIGKKDETKVKELLAQGANPNYEYGIEYRHQSIKRTVLILAASVGHPGIVQLLLNKGANVNAQGLIYGSESGLKYGTALEAAEWSKHAEVAALLKKQ